jgi:hypothetical protein
MNENKAPYFWGTCRLISNLNLDELSCIISEKLLSGLSFTYGKHSIWEEIPSMYIDTPFFGFLVILGGYGGESGYVLELSPYGNYLRFLESKKIDTERISLNWHLYYLLIEALVDHSEIQVVRPN